MRLHGFELLQKQDDLVGDAGALISPDDQSPSVRAVSDLSAYLSVTLMYLPACLPACLFPLQLPFLPKRVVIYQPQSLKSAIRDAQW